MTQQTAVNFLYEFVQLKLTHKQQMQFEGLFQQAKQMEKEQIEKAYEQGEEDGYYHPELGYGNKYDSAQQYYNETFTSTLPTENPSATRNEQS